MSDNYSDDFTPADCVAWLEKQGKNNMGISEATKQKLEDNLNKALEKETPESCNEFLDEQNPADTERGAKGNERENPNSEPPLTIIHAREVLGIKQDDAWSEKDEHNLNSVINLVHNTKDGAWGSCIGERIESWLKSLKDRVQPKQEWSKEDEKILNLIIARLHSHPNVEVEEYGKDYHWLKSIKERVFPQSKKEWSEEDENILRRAIIAIDCLWYKTNDDKQYYQNISDWLKSLKDRYTWKPSDGQMIVLNDIIINGHLSNANKRILKGLHEQLKKLREE